MLRVHRARLLACMQTPQRENARAAVRASIIPCLRRWGQRGSGSGRGRAGAPRKSCTATSTCAHLEAQVYGDARNGLVREGVAPKRLFRLVQRHIPPGPLFALFWGPTRHHGGRRARGASLPARACALELAAAEGPGRGRGREGEGAPASARGGRDCSG